MFCNINIEKSMLSVAIEKWYNQYNMSFEGEGKCLKINKWLEIVDNLKQRAIMNMSEGFIPKIIIL